MAFSNIFKLPAVGSKDPKLFPRSGTCKKAELDSDPK